MHLFFLLVCSFFSFSEDPVIQKVPVLFEGRYRLLGSCTMEGEEPKVLPLKSHSRSPNAGEWVSLERLERASANFTLYPNETFEEIRQAYLREDLPAVAHLLRKSYGCIAGTLIKEANGKELRYPTQLQLDTELFTKRAHLSLLVLSAYFLALLFWNQRKWGFLFFFLAFFLHSAVLALRCFILERPPVSNMQETLLYVPWIAAIAALFLRFFFKNNLFLFASSILSMILLVFMREERFENVQAVLDSRYWLIVHVLMVVGSYGIFLLSGILGHLFLFNFMRGRETPSYLPKAILQTLYLGTALLIPGTLLGGVWAAQSWGRFWDWDPKESWAFISSGVYLLWIHAYHFKKIAYFGLAIGSIVGLIAISFTWYGVNYILGTGLHSYGFGNGGERWYLLFLLLEVLFIAIALTLKFLLYKKTRIEKKEPSR